MIILVCLGAVERGDLGLGYIFLPQNTECKPNRRCLFENLILNPWFSLNPWTNIRPRRSRVAPA